MDQLANVVGLLASGNVPTELAAYISCAKLLASPKKCGGLRPIAVGEALRRLTAKCLCQAVKESTQQYLWPVQVGCGTKLGAETVIHTVRQWMGRNSDNRKLLLKISF